jgi:RNA polymerase sigma-70 factor (ECF subfamily)
MNGARIGPAQERPEWRALSDETVVGRVLGGEVALFEVLMRRYNQRVYRAARAILGDDAEAEDVMQHAYVQAYAHLGQFAGRAAFSTWLTKIAVYEALTRARRRSRERATDPLPKSSEDRMNTLRSTAPDPEQQAFRGELQTLIESAIEALPATYRHVLMLRDVDGIGPGPFCARSSSSVPVSSPLRPFRSISRAATAWCRRSSSG